MYDSNKAKKYSLDKLALLGLFVLSLAVAKLLVVSKSAVRLSSPIELPYSGLSLSLPSGNGWQSELKWRYQQNGFTLKSALAVKQSVFRAHAQCRYLLAADSRPLPELFNERESAIEGRATQTGQTKIANLTIDWARIEKIERSTVLFFATARLPDNRQLDIDILGSADESGTTELVFNLMINSIKFTDNNLLHAGADIVAQIRQQGLNAILASTPPYNKNSQLFFLLKDRQERPIGFLMDLFIDTGESEPLNIRAADYYYFRDVSPSEQAAFFQADSRFQKFVWRTETAGRTGTQIVADDPCLITVTRFDRTAEENVYQLNPAAIPDMLLDLAVIKMLDSGYDKIILDVINSDGMVVPTTVTKVRQGQNAVGCDNYPYVLKTEMLDGRGYSTLTCLDDQKQIVRFLLMQEQTYVVERVAEDDILRLFPERSDFVRHRQELLKQDSL